MQQFKRLFKTASMAVLAAVVFAACNQQSRETRKPSATTASSTAAVANVSAGKVPDIAFVVNGPAPFWTIAEAGVREAAAKYNVHASVLTPTGGIVEQKRLVEDAVAKGVAGIAISPIDPKNQIDLINQAASKTPLITFDSDAPGAKRLAYIGMDNYLAGRLCGQLIKEALPHGGRIMLFVAELEPDNARKRRQGIIDELLGRPPDSQRFDAASAVLKGNGYEVLGTLTDQFDQAKAKANAEDALTRFPKLSGMVGLYSYNTPMCLEALRQAHKLGKVKVVGFDEVAATLDAIASGNCHATVVQNPYMYGHESIRILAALARGDRSVLPPNGFMDIPVRAIRKDNVEEFRAELKRRLGGQ